MGPDRSDDLALSRLEDVLLSLPYDRALPDLHELLSRAGVDVELLRHDERARKLLHEAIVARPLSSVSEVTRVRTEVELLTLEVGVLTERLEDPDTPPGTREQTVARLAAVRARLEELRGLL